MSTTRKDPAAVALGKRGGLAKTDKKATAAKENGRLGGPPYRCNSCQKTFRRDNAEPVTVSGWYGNVRFDWGRVGGVHTCRATEVRCPHCGTERTLKYPFDQD